VVIAGAKYNTSQLVYACSETTYCCSSYPGKDVPVAAFDTKGNYSCCNDPSQVFDAGPANFLSGEKDFTTSMFPATAAPTAVGSGKTLTVFKTMGSGVTGVATAAAAQSTDPLGQSNPRQDSSSGTALSSSSDLSTAAKAGIAIGAAAVAVLAIVSAAWLMLRMRQQRLQENIPSTNFDAAVHHAVSQGRVWQEQKSGAMLGYAYEIGHATPGPMESDARELNELDGRRFSRRRELP
jgi:hypothetical protein